ncbi:MAG: hypothetical protein ACRDBG_07715, partial [Waterburya sp.]
ILFGTGPGVTSDPNLQYNSINRTLSMNTIPGNNFDFQIQSRFAKIAGSGGLLINATTNGYGFGSAIAIKADSIGHQARRYMLFADSVWSGYQLGSNEANDFILFSGYSGIHNLLIDRNGANADLQLNAAGTTGKILLNNNIGAGSEVEFYSGGATPVKTASFGNYGNYMWNGLPVRARSFDNNKYLEMQSDNNVSNLRSNQKVLISSEELSVVGSNTTPYSYRNGLILNHYQQLSSPFHFYSDLVSNSPGQFNNTNLRFFTQESGAIPIQRMIISNVGNTFIGSEIINPSYRFEVGGTGAMKTASGTTAQRPAVQNGGIRHNSTTDKLETVIGGVWTSLLNVGDAIQNIGTFQNTGSTNGLSISSNNISLHSATSTTPGALDLQSDQVLGQGRKIIEQNSDLLTPSLILRNTNANAVSEGTGLKLEGSTNTEMGNILAIRRSSGDGGATSVVIHSRHGNNGIVKLLDLDGSENTAEFGGMVKYEPNELSTSQTITGFQNRVGNFHFRTAGITLTLGDPLNYEIGTVIRFMNTTVTGANCVIDTEDNVNLEFFWATDQDPGTSGNQFTSANISLSPAARGEIELVRVGTQKKWAVRFSN